MSDTPCVSLPPRRPDTAAQLAEEHRSYTSPGARSGWLTDAAEWVNGLFDHAVHFGNVANPVVGGSIMQSKYLDAFTARILVVCAILFGLPSYSAHAQTLSFSQGDSANALALVRELPNRNLAQDFVQEFRRKLLTEAPARLNRSPAEMAVIVDRVLIPEFYKLKPELESTLAAIWSSRFTEGEIAELLLFIRNRSPLSEERFVASSLGKKYLAQRDEINLVNGRATAEWAVRASRIAFSHNADLVRSLGIDPITGERIQGTPQP